MAIRRYRSRFSALWWVVNGRAIAPPYSGCSTGVSTSMKPSSSRNRRIVEITRARVMNSRRASSFDSRSSSRWRKRVSTSDRPWCFSGGGRSDLASSVKSPDPQRQLSAARAHGHAVDADQIAEVEPQQPLHALAAELVDAGLELDAARAVDQIQERHLALPAARGQAPGDAVLDVVSSPACNCSCAARTPAIASTPSNSCGNGSHPRRAQRLQLLPARRQQV